MYNNIATILGVVPPPPSTPAPMITKTGKSGWAPPQPLERREYVLHFSRTEYGSYTVFCSDTEDPFDVFHAEATWSDINWHETGEISCDDSEAHSSAIVNQDEIDDWNAEYQNKYDTDGQPKCSLCDAFFNHAYELTDIDDESWACAACLSDHPTDTEDDA